MSLHGVPVSIVSNRGTQFTSKFWESFQKALGTQLRFSTVFHPQADGQSKRTIKTLEDMLRACILDFERSWDQHLSLVEFAYNNSYPSTIQMAPYEALYSRKCRSLIGLFEVSDHPLLGPYMILDVVRKVQLVQDKMRAAQS